jgi:two-component system OmpR family sensor kinase
MKSIRRELFVWLSIGLLLAVVAAATGTYLRARDEANTLFDFHLKEMAASLTGSPLSSGITPASAKGTGSDALVVQIWDKHGVRVYLSHSRREPPKHKDLGFSDVTTTNGDWRVFSVVDEDHVVQIAQPMSARRDLAASMALHTIAPLLVVMPFLVLLVWYTIRRALRPLDRVAAAVGRRSSSALEPLSEQSVPNEVQPLVHALNGLLHRLGTALDGQRAFIADAAHELRTPVTAVNLQAQVAERATTDDERRAALRQLRAGLDRASHLIDQLLTLAREEPGVAERPPARIDLRELASEVIGEQAGVAAARGVDLGLVESNAPPIAGAFTVDGDAAGLATLVSALVDNAVRYTPSGGRVDVAVTRDGNSVVLNVCDSGRGIPPDEQARVFDRFYRAGNVSDIPGSGLGLAIVKSVADRHGAQLALAPGYAGPAGAGLSVTLRFPSASSDSPA